ncbi:MAG: hypothetical protein Roseis2KO_03350 [Roseivirga sp.]
MNQTTKKVKAVDVGSFISEEYSNQLQQSFKAAYPGTETRFTFSKDLMLKVLSLSKKIVGIRFMFGLADELNPNSVKLILVPCTSPTEYMDNSKPLIFTSGYFDNKGGQNSIKESSQLIAAFVQNMKSRNNNLEYKRITRGAFVGKNSLLALTEDNQCEHIALNFGLRDGAIEPVFEPLNKYKKAYLGIYLEYVGGCPPLCLSPNEEQCFGLLAVDLFSGDMKEKLFYLNLRDEMLSGLKNGKVYYEMFHFISPIVSLLIPRMNNQEKVLAKIYKEKLVPLRQLLLEERFEEATELIANGLDELVEEFEMTKTESLLEEMV